MAELEPVYLITGSDRPKVELAVQRLRARFDPGATDRFLASVDDSATVVAACNAGTLFGDSRLVIVEEVDGRRGDEGGRLRATWKKADVDAVLAYLGSPAPGTVLCLVGEEVRSDAPLAKACAKAGSILTYDVARRGLNGWVAERFRARSVKAEPEACALLVQLVGDDLHALAQEIDKIATWAGEDPIGEREVEQLTAPTAEAPVFAITDAWGRRDRAAALAAMESILERSDRPRRDEAARIAGSLGSHLSRLRQMKRAAANGERPKEIAARAKLHPFYAEKLFRQAEGFSDAELDDATLRVAALDHALKGGSRLAPELELQRALAAISREPGQHA